jgi:hypothetical protein
MAEMKLAIFLLGCCSFLLTGCVSSTAPPQSWVVRNEYSGAVIAADIQSPQQLTEVRDKGPAGLKQLLGTNAGLIADMRADRLALDDPRAATMRTMIDSVAKQRDAFASGLYWYTDLEAAKAEAARTGRHILSLRLLGNLDEEYSCANSRFFRTALYANTTVSGHLRDHYVLHWKSVRPAPLVTIDMGDGRRIKRTITGNSIHYVPARIADRWRIG